MPEFAHFSIDAVKVLWVEPDRHTFADSRARQRAIIDYTTVLNDDAVTYRHSVGFLTDKCSRNR